MLDNHDNAHEFGSDSAIVDVLMQMTAMLEPVIDWAVGFRANLVERGWSEGVADAVSGAVLNRVITMGMGGDK